MRDIVKAAFWGMISGLAILTIILAGGNGCAVFAHSSEDPTRATARAAVLTVAEAVKVADQFCATYSLQTKEITVAKACADAYDLSRNSLLAAESGLDVWNDVTKNSVACALADGVRSLGAISAVLIQEKLAPPAIITDALTLVNSFQVCVK